MIANLKRHNLKHNPRITPVEVLSASNFVQRVLFPKKNEPSQVTLKEYL